MALLRPTVEENRVRWHGVTVDSRVISTALDLTDHLRSPSMVSNHAAFHSPGEYLEGRSEEAILAQVR